MVRIEIQSNKVDERSGTIRAGERKGEKFTSRKQEAWLHHGKAYPALVELSIPEGQNGYEPGMYTLAPESFEAGEYNRLQLAYTLVLVPEQGAAAPRKVA